MGTQLWRVPFNWAPKVQGGNPPKSLRQKDRAYRKYIDNHFSYGILPISYGWQGIIYCIYICYLPVSRVIWRQVFCVCSCCWGRFVEEKEKEYVGVINCY